MRRFLKLSALVTALAVFLSACSLNMVNGDPPAELDFIPITVADIHDVLHALQHPYDWVIVDVRTPGEFDSGRIAGAVHIEWDRAVDGTGNTLPEEELREVFAEVLDGRSIIVYCRSGARASHTLEVLGSLGAHVLNYEGSWNDWSHAAVAHPERDLILSFTEA